MSIDDDTLKKRLAALKGPIPTDNKLNEGFQKLTGYKPGNPRQAEKNYHAEKDQNLNNRLHELQKFSLSRAVPPTQKNVDQLKKQILKVTSFIKTLEETAKTTKTKSIKEDYHRQIDSWKKKRQVLTSKLANLPKSTATGKTVQPSALTPARLEQKHTRQEQYKTPNPTYLKQHSTSQMKPANLSQRTATAKPMQQQRTSAHSLQIELVERGRALLEPARAVDKQCKTPYEARLNRILHHLQQGKYSAKTELAIFEKQLKRRETQLAQRKAIQSNLQTVRNSTQACKQVLNKCISDSKKREEAPPRHPTHSPRRWR